MSGRTAVQRSWAFLSPLVPSLRQCHRRKRHHTKPLRVTLQVHRKQGHPPTARAALAAHKLCLTGTLTHPSLQQRGRLHCRPWQKALPKWPRQRQAWRAKSWGHRHHHPMAHWRPVQRTRRPCLQRSAQACTWLPKPTTAAQASAAAAALMTLMYQRAQTASAWCSSRRRPAQSMSGPLIQQSSMQRALVMRSAAALAAGGGTMGPVQLMQATNQHGPCGHRATASC